MSNIGQSDQSDLTGSESDFSPVLRKVRCEDALGSEEDKEWESICYTWGTNPDDESGTDEYFCERHYYTKIERARKESGLTGAIMKPDRWRIEKPTRLLVLCDQSDGDRDQKGDDEGHYADLVGLH